MMVLLKKSETTSFSPILDALGRKKVTPHPRTPTTCERNEILQGVIMQCIGFQYLEQSQFVYFSMFDRHIGLSVRYLKESK